MNIGDIINGYTIIDVIDHGGIGQVFTVLKDGKEYAMKNCLLTDETPKKCFEREYHLMESVNGKTNHRCCICEDSTARIRVNE